MLDHAPRVQSLPDRQYRSGEVRVAERQMDVPTYSAALDALVLVCVDFIPLCEGQMLLSRRTRLPHDSWWVNGGRMRKGEQFGEAAARLAGVELGLAVHPGRFQLLGYYSLMWDARAQEPQDSGCHTLSVTHALPLSAGEAAGIRLNEEYSMGRWVAAGEVLDGAPEYHPALVQMTRDLLGTVALRRTG